MTKKRMIKPVPKIHLDVGCGFSKNPGFIGMDKRAVDGVDIVHDAEDLPWPLEDESCSVIAMSHLIEHIKPWLQIDVINECWRVLEVNGVLAIATPYATSFGYSQDPTHCFSDDTEVLTNNGFKKITKVKLKELVLTLNPSTLKTEFSACINKIYEHYTGPMLEFKTKRMDLAVTPNHSIFSGTNAKKSNFKLHRADELLSLNGNHSRKAFCQIDWRGQDHGVVKIPRVKRGGNNAGKKMPVSFDIADFMTFLGWYISEGSVWFKEGHAYIVSIAQSKEKHPENYEEIRRLIVDMGFTPKLSDDSVSFSSKDMTFYLRELGKSKTKKIPQAFKNLSRVYLMPLLESLIKGDGSQKR